MEIKVKRIKYLIGIDEVGRGPLAGPVYVCAVVSTGKNLKILNGIKDSKKLSPKQREEWNKILFKNFKYSFASVSPKIIDKIGIKGAINTAISMVIKNLSKKIILTPRNCRFLLDGCLKAPKIYNQNTIIKGDEKIPLISAASIIAKVARDKKMLGLHKKTPEYRFDLHKGYGTALHYNMIKKFGFSEYHRRTFCRKLKNSEFSTGNT